MKKLSASIFCGIIAATSLSLCACGSTPAAQSDAPSPILPQLQTQPDSPVVPEPRSTEQQTPTEKPPFGNGIKIRFGGGIERFNDGLFDVTPIAGVKRLVMHDRTGTYGIEYIHTPYGIDKDETLDYKLKLNDDNTFELSVVSNGVGAEHYGKYYERRGNLMLYYDEPLDPTAHNVYVSDCLYADILNGGKLMIYDNCHTIVLARENND